MTTRKLQDEKKLVECYLDLDNPMSVAIAIMNLESGLYANKKEVMDIQQGVELIHYAEDGNIIRYNRLGEKY